MTQFYEYAHDVLHIHFWDVFSIIALLLISVVGFTHTILQQEREMALEENEEKTEENSYEVKEEAA